MKLFQKTYPLVGIMLLLSGGVLLAVHSRITETVNLPRTRTGKVFARYNAISSINNAYKKVFEKDNLFDRENRDTDSWFEMLDGLQSYVKKNAGGDEELFSAFGLCRDVSDQLIRTLKIVYSSLFAIAGRGVSLSRVTQPILDKARSDVKQLMARKADLTNMSRMLKKVRFDHFIKQKSILSVKKQKSVEGVLLHLILKLGTAIDKLGRDFDERDRW